MDSSTLYPPMLRFLVIVGTATCLARMMTVENIPRLISETVQNATDSKFVVLLLINVVLLIAGCVMDASPVITILAPILYPIVAAYGVDPIHFGVMFLSIPPSAISRRPWASTSSLRLGWETVPLEN